jgi:hypothetical protein
MRELAWMARSRREAEWARAALLAAEIANHASGYRRSRAMAAKDFNPYAAPAAQQPLIRASVGELKDLFVSMGFKEVVGHRS